MSLFAEEETIVMVFEKLLRFVVNNFPFMCLYILEYLPKAVVKPRKSTCMTAGTNTGHGHIDVLLYLDGQNCPWLFRLHGICEPHPGFSSLEHFQHNSVNHLQNNHWISKSFFGREMLTVFCLDCYAWVITLSGTFSHYEIPSHDSKSSILLLHIFQKYVLL